MPKLLFRHHKLLSPAEAIRPVFAPCLFTVETDIRPSGRTAGGQQEQTDKQPDNPNGICTSVGYEKPSDVGLLGGISVRFYDSTRISIPPNVPTIVGKSSFNMRPVQCQTVPYGRHKLPRNRKRRPRAQVWLHLSRTQNMAYGSSNYRKENL